MGESWYVPPGLVCPANQLKLSPPPEATKRLEPELVRESPQIPSLVITIRIPARPGIVPWCGAGCYSRSPALSRPRRWGAIASAGVPAGLAAVVAVLFAGLDDAPLPQRAVWQLLVHAARVDQGVVAAFFTR